MESYKIGKGDGKSCWFTWLIVVLSRVVRDGDIGINKAQVR